MNPIIIKEVASGAKKVFTNKYVLITIIVLVVLFVMKGGLKRAIRALREKVFDSNETKDVNQIAQQYRSAANPSGLSWMINMDGTDTKAIERLAYQTKDSFDEVSQAYRQKFDETLTDRLRDELSTEDFQNWYNIVS